jgi:hypothetical protein
VINRRRQQPHHSLERRVLTGRWVAARRYKRLVPAKRRRQLLRLLASLMMLFAVFFGHLFALVPEVLLESRVDD